MYTTPSGNPLNPYSGYKDFNSLYPIYIEYQNLYYNTRQALPITQRINDPSNLPPKRQTLYSLGGQIRNFDYFYGTQDNPNLMKKYSKPYYSMKEPNNDGRSFSFAELGKATSNVSVHGYNIY